MNEIRKLRRSPAYRRRLAAASAHFRIRKTVCFFAGSSRVRFANNTDAALSTVARLRPDRDFHVLAERSQEAHQALAGEVREPSVEQRRHLRLIDAHEPRRR